jgi:gamma-glutamyltranspeptidase/glutathione hydrolase
MNGKRPTISSVHGMVAAAHPLAVQAGARMLANGGNAFDAAVATSAALNVVEPFMSGLAGLGLATCYVAAEKRVRVLDFTPPVPSKFPVERFTRREEMQRGAMAVGTPGNLGGWTELQRTYGKLKLKDAFAPAIALARDGFPIIEFGVFEISSTAPEIAAHPSLHPIWSETYTGGKGTVEQGFLLRQPDLARTLEALASEGADHFYRGALGRAVIAHLDKLGGCLTMADLESMKAVWREPQTASYRGLTVNVPPPPCEGFQFLLTLRILEGFDLGRMERNGIDHVDTVCRAIRLAAGVRIANNAAANPNVAELLSDAHVETLRRRVKDGKPIEGPTEQWIAPPPGGAAAESHTTSLSVVDRDGNAICITQSLGSPFGSAVVVPGTGLCLNNFLYWADVNPESPNRTKPGANLPMCVTPSISTKAGKPVLVLGTPGSYGILQTQPQAMVQYIDFGLPLQDAIEAPRTRLWDGRQIEPEARLSEATIAALRQRGHEVTPGPDWTMRVGGMQGVAINQETGVLTGACDPRRDGYVATP